MLPGCSMVAVHEHPPVAALSTQTTLVRPIVSNPRRSQEVWNPETSRHAFSSSKAAVPLVVVVSVYFPSAVTVNTPVTVRDPLTSTVLQPSPTGPRSVLPPMAISQDCDVQVPTASPPQGAASEHAPMPLPPLLSPPPPPPLPPFAACPPVVLAPPVGVAPPVAAPPVGLAPPVLAPPVAAPPVEAPPVDAAPPVPGPFEALS